MLAVDLWFLYGQAPLCSARMALRWLTGLSVLFSFPSSALSVIVAAAAAAGPSKPRCRCCLLLPSPNSAAQPWPKYMLLLLTCPHSLPIFPHFVQFPSVKIPTVIHSRSSPATSAAVKPLWVRYISVHLCACLLRQCFASIAHFCAMQCDVTVLCPCRASTCNLFLTVS